MCRLSILSLIVLAIAIGSCQQGSQNDFNFEEQAIGLEGHLRGVSVANADVVWVSGPHGQFATSSNGGANWFSGSIPGADSLDLRDVHAFSATEAVVMSAGPGTSSKIFRTIDGGKSWELKFTNQQAEGFFDGFDFHQKVGLLFSDPVDSRLNLYVSHDAGNTWAALDPADLPPILPGEYAFAASGTSLQFDPSGGIWLATGGSMARIWYASSIDGQWTVWDTPALQGNAAAGLFSIAPRSSIRVVAVGGHYQEMEQSGQNVVLQQRAGKASWMVPDGASHVPFMECVKWYNSSGLIACGPPGVWISNDRGLSWTELRVPGYHALDLDIKEKIGWAVGGSGRVIRFSW